MASAAAARVTSATSPPTTPPVKRARIAAVADTENGSRKSPDPEGWTEAVQVADPSYNIPPPPKSALFVSPSSEAVGRLPAAVDGANADSNASSSGIDSGFSDSGGGSDSPPPALAPADAPAPEGPAAAPAIVVGPEFGGQGVSEASCPGGGGASKSIAPKPTMSKQPHQGASGVNEVEGGQAEAEATVSVEKGGNSNAPSPSPSLRVEAPNDDARATSAGDQDSASDVSEISGLSGANWKPEAGPFSWVQSQMIQGRDPRPLLQDMLSSDVDIPDDLDQMTLWRIILNLLTEPERRKKLEHVNTIEDVVGLIAKSKNIIVLTGAGVSVSCGIPDFRSKDGVYARLAVDFPDLPDPQAMFDIQYFKKDPRPFFKFAREIYPGQFQPSPCHKFIKALEHHEKLLRNYTQNIDTLEQVVGIERVVQCHGSFATASCTKCKRKVDAEDIREDIFAQRIPSCPVCQDRIEAYKQIQNIETSPQPLTTTTVAADESAPMGQTGEQQQREDDTYREGDDVPNAPRSENAASGDPMLQPGIMKPDIVFFGEGLGDEFHNSVARDKERADLLIMIGSSLKVRPVALIPSSVPKDIPQVLINREPLTHIAADVELLGDCDVIVDKLCRMLGWERVGGDGDLEESRELLEKAEDKSVREWQERKREEEERRQEQQNSGTPATAATEAGSSEGNEHSEVTHLDPTPFWQHRERKSLATRLPDSKYYFHPPSRYVFPGAEVYSDEEDSDGDSDSSDDESTVDGNDGDDNIEETTARETEQAEPDREQNQNDCASGREVEERGTDAGQQSNQ